MLNLLRMLNLYSLMASPGLAIGLHNWQRFLALLALLLALLALLLALLALLLALLALLLASAIWLSAIWHRFLFGTAGLAIGIVRHWQCCQVWQYNIISSKID